MTKNSENSLNLLKSNFNNQYYSLEKQFSTWIEFEDNIDEINDLVKNEK